jgi:TetR/AcrR family transcriptional regulator, transcriptional repressor for nem operon
LRDPERTRAKILEAGFEVVYRRGFRASSINEIVSRAGVTQGAFFHYFPTKNDLGYALVDEVLTEMMLDRWIRPLAAYRNPVQGMIARYRKNMEATTEDEMAFGCPLNNLTQEMSPVDPIFKEKINAVLTTWIAETERYLRKAQAGGFLKPEANVKDASRFIVMIEEGSGGIMKNLLNRNTYHSLYESFRQYLESLSGVRISSAAGSLRST